MTKLEPSTEERARMARRNRVTALVLTLWFVFALVYAMSRFRIPSL